MTGRILDTITPPPHLPARHTLPVSCCSVLVVFVVVFVCRVLVWCVVVGPECRVEWAGGLGGTPH